MIRWRQANPEREPELNPVERARLRELEDQNRTLKIENEFLKELRLF